MKVNNIIASVIAMFLVGTGIYPGAGTLPLGVTKLSLSYHATPIQSVGGILPGDTRYSGVGIRDATFWHVKAYHGLPESIGRMKILDDWLEQSYELTAAYGLTSRLTGFVTLGYDTGFRRYTDEAKAFFDQLYEDSLASTTSTQTIRAHGLSNVKLGIKYRPEINWRNLGLDESDLAIVITANPIKVGYSEQDSKRDNVEGNSPVSQIPAVDDHTTYSAVILYDHLIDKGLFHASTTTLEFTLGVIVSTPGYEYLLGQDIDYDYGDTIVFGVGTSYDLYDAMSWIEGVTLSASVTELIRFSDRYSVDGGAWQTEPNSHFGTVLDVEVAYTPVLEYSVWASVSFNLANTEDGFLFTYPGRVNPGTSMSIGMSWLL